MDLGEVVLGNGPAPLLVLSLIEGMDERSLMVAEMGGGRERLGWGEDRSLLASIYDAINLNTIATGNFKKGKAPEIPPWPRPNASGSGEGKSTKKTTVKDLFKRFDRR